MSVISAFASLFGLLYCLGVMLEKNWAWYAGILNVLLYGYYCYTISLYGELGLQGIYLLLSIAGLLNWNLGGNLKISYSKIGSLFVLLVIVVCFAILYATILSKVFISLYPILDGTLVSLSLAATWLTIRKKIENWILWIPINLCYVGMYVMLREWPLVVLFFIFFVLSILGLQAWTTVYKNVQNSNHGS